MANALINLTVGRLKRAVALKQKIEQLEKDLAGLLGIPEALTPGGTIRRHKKMSKMARDKISAAVKARWATRAAKKSG